MALICAACGTENPDDAYFCGKCGAQVWSAFNQPAGPVAGSVAPQRPDPLAPTESPNRIAPPPPAAVDSTSGGSPFLIDKPASPPARSQPIAPPPPASSNYAPQDYGQYQTPVTAAPLPGGYAPTGYAPGYAPPPPDGNTSGMGSTYPAPAEAQGWTFAGCIPFGLFGFLNGSTLWGALGLGGSFIGLLGTIYAIYIGIKGKELAWQNRRFDSLHQFNDTMRAWNNWGIFVLVIQVVLAILYVFLVVGLGVMGAMSEGAYDSDGTAPTDPTSISSSVLPNP